MASLLDVPNFGATDNVAHLFWEPIAVSILDAFPRKGLFGGLIEGYHIARGDIPQRVMMPRVFLAQGLVRGIPHIRQSDGIVVVCFVVVRFVPRSEAMRHTKAIAVIGRSSEHGRR